MIKAVTLINVAISNRGFDSFNKDNYINHGIASLAAYVSKHGYKPTVIDLRYLKDWNEFRKIIKKSNDEVFGISSLTVDFGFAIKVAKIIKKIKKKSIVVVGGVHPTVRPLEAIKIKEFDYVVTGEGEIALLDLLKKKENGEKIKRLITGVSCNLEEIPHIDRELFHFTEGEMLTPVINELETPFATIMSSRGCPFNCAFCQPAERQVSGGKVRMRKMEDFIGEIKELHEKYGIKSFLIHDDLFTMSKERLEEFIDLYKKTGIKAKFMCQSRADLIIRYKDVFKKLKKVGLVAVFVGFESGSQRILDFINKGVTVEQNLEAGRICKELGIKIWANYMMAIPTETYGDIIKTLRMIKKMNPEVCSPSLFTPYPNTHLYDYCKKNNLLIFKKYTDYRRGLVGKKVKGFNYPLIRFLFYIYLPFNAKVTFAKSFFRFLKRKIRGTT